MSLTYKSQKRNRVYARKFDHELCRTLYSHGCWTQRGLAEFFGVTVSRIRQVLIPEYAATCTARVAAKNRSHSHDCARCGEAISYCAAHNTRRRGRDDSICGKCRERLDSPTVRPDTLRCNLCHQWLPDDDFPRRTEARARRGRHSSCRPCGREAKRLWRLGRTPEQRAEDNARDRARRHAREARRA